MCATTLSTPFPPLYFTTGTNLCHGYVDRLYSHVPQTPTGIPCSHSLTKRSSVVARVKPSLVQPHLHCLVGTVPCMTCVSSSFLNVKDEGALKLKVGSGILLGRSHHGRMSNVKLAHINLAGVTCRIAPIT